MYADDCREGNSAGENAEHQTSLCVCGALCGVLTGCKKTVIKTSATIKTKTHTHPPPSTNYVTVSHPLQFIVTTFGHFPLQRQLSSPDQ